MADGGGGVGGYNIYYSHGGSLNAYYGIRPIVFLKSDVQINKFDGTKENPHRLLY